jgi:hypothetical protein
MYKGIKISINIKIKWLQSLYYAEYAYSYYSCMMYHSSYHLQYDIPHLSTFIWNFRFMSTFKEDYDGALNERLKQGTCIKACHINSHNSSSICTQQHQYHHYHHYHHLYHINSTCIYDIGTVEYRLVI